MRVQRFEQGAGGVTELALDATARVLWVGDDAGVLRLWSLDDPPRRLRDVEPTCGAVDGLAWLPDRDAVAVAGPGGVEAWTTEGAPFGAWPTLDAPAQALAVVDARRALVAAADARLRLVDFVAGRVLGEVEAGDRNTGIAPHPDGRRFALSACEQGGSVVRWVAVDGDALVALDDPQIERPVDHLGAPAIDGAGTHLMLADHRLGVFDIATGQRVAGFNGDGKPTRLRLGDGVLVERPWTQAARLGDHQLACASPDGPVLIYDAHARSLEIRRDLARPATALGSDGPVLCAASLDWSLVVWWP